MKLFSSLVLKHAVKTCTLAATLTLGVTAIHADTIHFAGSDTGAFNSGTQSSQTTLNTLTYYGSTFNDTTSAAGFLAFGGNGVASTSNFNNFGSFQLSNANANYAPGANNFQLMITFTAPTGIGSGQSTTFNALVFGQVTSMTNGGVQVAFSPSNQSYTFSNGAQTGSFTLNINSVSINPGQVASVTGYITSSASSTAVTPEPSSLMLLGTGLMSAAGMVVRRRSI